MDIKKLHYRGTSGGYPLSGATSRERAAESAKGERSKGQQPVRRVGRSASAGRRRLPAAQESIRADGGKARQSQGNHQEIKCRYSGSAACVLLEPGRRKGEFPLRIIWFREIVLCRWLKLRLRLVCWTRVCQYAKCLTIVS